MSVTGVSPNIAPLVQSTLDINNQLSDLTRQLGTGQKADTYAGLGPQSGIALSLSAQLSALSSYDSTMTMVGTNINLQQSVLQQIDSVGNSLQGTLAQQPAFAIDSTGQTSTQQTAADQLGQILDLLNTQGTNGYMFSGTAVDQPSVASVDQILNGNGAQAGLKTVVTQRQQADLGTGGLCRLVIPPASGSTVSVSEDGSDFGLKLTSVSSQLTGATASGPTGSPPSISVDLGATNPSPGDTISFTFAMPDGSSQTLTLTATNASPPGANQFSIGATTADTANNLQAALTAGVQQIGQTTLPAASAMAAANDFFGDPPMRVDTPASPSTATNLVAGTSADTVFWYTGENGSLSSPVRASATARIDPQTTVSYGTQANEEGIRWIVQNVAVLAATSYSASDPNAAAQYQALSQSVHGALAVPNGVQSISDIEASLASAQTTIQSTQNQHQDTSNTLTTMLQSIEGVDQTQLGAQILSLQTSLSASLQTTARLAQINLVNYLAPVTG